MIMNEGGIVRAAIVGLRHGHMGSLNPKSPSGLLGTFQRMPEVRVVALCEGADAATLARELMYLPGAHGYDNVDALVQNEQFDVAVVALPAAEAPTTALTLIGAGKHCFLEKSVARTAEEFEPVVEAADQNGVHIAVGFPWRLHPAVRMIENCLKEGLLGRPLAIAAQMTTTQVGSWAGQRDPSGFWYTREGEGGGMLHWLGSHVLEVMCSLMGSVQSVSAMCFPVVGNLVPGPTMDDVSSISLLFRNQAVGTLHTGYLDTVPGSKHDFLQVWGTDGCAYWPALGSQLTVSSRAATWSGPPTRTVEFDLQKLPGVYGESQWMFDTMQAFVQGLQDGTPPLVGAREALQVLTIIGAAYEASHSHRWMDLDHRSK